MSWKLLEILTMLKDAGLPAPTLKTKRNGGTSYHFGEFGLSQSTDSDTWWVFKGLGFKEYPDLQTAIERLKQLLNKNSSLETKQGE